MIITPFIASRGPLCRMIHVKDSLSGAKFGRLGLCGYHFVFVFLRACFVVVFFNVMSRSD